MNRKNLIGCAAFSSIVVLGLVVGIKSHAEKVTKLPKVKLSTLDLQAKKIEDEIAGGATGARDVRVRVVGQRFFLEGAVDLPAERKVAVEICRSMATNKQILTKDDKDNFFYSCVDLIKLRAGLSLEASPMFRVEYKILSWANAQAGAASLLAPNFYDAKELPKDVRLIKSVAINVVDGDDGRGEDTRAPSSVPEGAGTQAGFGTAAPSTPTAAPSFSPAPVAATPSIFSPSPAAAQNAAPTCNPVAPQSSFYPTTTSSSTFAGADRPAVAMTSETFGVAVDGVAKNALETYALETSTRALSVPGSDKINLDAEVHIRAASGAFDKRIKTRLVLNNGVTAGIGSWVGLDESRGQTPAIVVLVRVDKIRSSQATVQGNTTPTEAGQ